jgi:uncharacterized protein (DUF2236 family)
MSGPPEPGIAPDVETCVRPPHTATYRVHIDRAIWAGGVRGLMLQALHPGAMLGVWQNSDFQRDPFGRLRRTADYVGRVTFGSAAEADEVGRRVRGIHKALRVRDPATGRTLHRVDDPELLLWVHCAEVSSYLEVARRAGVGLDDRQADRYLAEQRQTATYVGLHAEDVPGSLAEMADYFASVRPSLAATPEAVATVRFLIWPRLPRDLRLFGPAKPLYAPFGALCYYLLPGWARRMYGGLLPELPGPAVTAALRAFRLAANALPEPVHDRMFQPTTRAMLAAARDRLAAAGYDLSRGLMGLTDPRRWPPGRRTPPTPT